MHCYVVPSLESAFVAVVALGMRPVEQPVAAGAYTPGTEVLAADLQSCRAALAAGCEACPAGALTVAWAVVRRAALRAIRRRIPHRRHLHRRARVRLGRPECVLVCGVGHGCGGRLT